MPPALAVNVAACAVVTDETEAVNAALVALAATVTVAGTLTAALLLDRLTLNPPLGATALSDIVPASLHPLWMCCCTKSRSTPPLWMAFRFHSG